MLQSPCASSAQDEFGEFQSGMAVEEDVSARLESLQISGKASGSPGSPESSDQGRLSGPGEARGGGLRRKEELVVEERQEEGRRRHSHRTPPPSSPPPEDSLVFLPVEVRPEELRDWAVGGAAGAGAGAALVEANGERLAVFR